MAGISRSNLRTKLESSDIVEESSDYESPLARKASTPPLPSLTPKLATPRLVTPKQAAPKRKTPKRVRITESDLALLEAVYSAGRITLPQLARAVGSVTDNKRARVNALVREGYLGVDHTHEMKRYWIRTKGLAAIGHADERERSVPPAASTLSHTNKLNSILIGLSLGDQAFNELSRREVEAANRDLMARNLRWEEENELLAKHQADLAGKSLLSDAEARLMRRKPKSLSPLIPFQEPKGFFAGEHGPKIVIPELLMLRDERMKGELACRRDWEADAASFLADPSFPSRREGEPINLTEADREYMRAVLAKTANGNAGYLFKHWNLSGRFEKKHGWDGVIVLPHIVHADGTLSGGSWAIEMEENKKGPAEIERVLEQAIDHPLLAGVIYYTDKRQIATRVKEARDRLVLKMASRDRDFSKSIEEKRNDAAALVGRAVKVQKPLYINWRASKHGLWG